MSDFVIKDEEFECVDHDGVMSSSESDLDVVSIESKPESLANTNYVKPNARARHSADGASTQSKHHKCEDKHDSESTDATTSDDTESILELCIVLDVTASMGVWLKKAQEECVKIVDSLKESSDAKLRVAGVVFRDLKDNFVTQVSPFTEDVQRFSSFLNQYQARGGNDIPEAIGSALHAATELSWTKLRMVKSEVAAEVISTGGTGLERAANDPTRVLVLVTDSYPHGLVASGDHFPQGETHDPLEQAHKLAKMGVTIHTIGVGEIDTYPIANEFMHKIASLTQGRSVRLDSATSIPELILGSVMQEKQRDDLMERATKHLNMMKLSGMSNDDAVEAAYRSLSQEVKTTGRKLISIDVATAQVNGTTFDNCSSLKEARKKWGEDSYTPTTDTEHIDPDDMVQPAYRSLSMSACTHSKSKPNAYRGISDEPSAQPPQLKRHQTICREASIVTTDLSKEEFVRVLGRRMLSTA